MHAVCTFGCASQSERASGNSGTRIAEKADATPRRLVALGSAPSRLKFAPYSPTPPTPPGSIDCYASEKLMGGWEPTPSPSQEGNLGGWGDGRWRYLYICTIKCTSY
ncbi:hypothetical protein [Okeania sp. SIO2B3]|uniref:hypothetical protein n=1 Tax=Okeania sp. SIO2B3 TaxID=2607784 RepID=UPI0025E6E129|nr:hypothetical protein [Okeania sp. SIO2B3]